MAAKIKRIAINTGGGDAPGLNAVIRAVVISAANKGWEVVGIRDGYNGLLLPGDYPEGGLIPLTRSTVRGITHLGGTILGTTNKGNPAKYPTQDKDGRWYEADRTGELVQLFKKNKIDALVALGGDGSLGIANLLAQKGLRVVGVPKTIDNDLKGTVATFGFDTAVAFATECLDRLHSTAEAHRRVMVVEVMGRYAGWIALNAGISGTADAILIPEIAYDLRKVAASIKYLETKNKYFAIVVVAEGAKPRGGKACVVSKELGRQEKLGGVGEQVARELQELTGRECRTVVLGHLLRGGSPTTFDRLISLRFGAAAVRALEEGKSGVMVALDPPKVRYVPLAQATQRLKTVPPDCDTVLTARSLGISFGD
ncbi:MAG: 6-phosphofructokinase [Elusimicrobia bacterium GWA2_64_40]|nr:MAG: 6-phosphofructokinase [Elusimicrobia bacterium GWA2_64_40]OGR63695.1 MAG: 6-phosphofructokinase [Elusimicrobia bacterium GWB2_63_16]HAN05099.1 6-phosphofructokinase [Elusimicrobiota bacterium]